MEIMHFKSQKERLDYLKGNYSEITPQIAEEIVPEKAENSNLNAENEKKSPKKASKSKKSASKSKKEAKNDELQAE